MGKFMKYVMIYLLAVNFVTFCAYGIDKRKARRGKWRMKERTLIGLAILGGSIGAFLGMQLFHHKTRRRKFTIGIPVIFLLQTAVWFYMVHR